MSGPTTSSHLLIRDTSHCAEAILSLSNEITLVGSVAAPLLDFASTWAQSNSSYDFIIARAFPPSWCSLHRPVISLRDPMSHWVYSAIDPLEPNGQLVLCHRGCGRDNLQPTVITQTVKIRCIHCQSTCEVRATAVDARTPIGRSGILKVAFPTQQAETNWNPPRGQGKSGAAGQGDGKIARGRRPKRNLSQAQADPMQRPQAHSVPRRLPSQTLLPHPSPISRTMSRPHHQDPYHTMASHTPQTPHVLQSSQLPFTWIPPSLQTPEHRQRQAKRPRIEREPPAPPS